MTKQVVCLEEVSALLRPLDASETLAGFGYFYKSLNDAIRANNSALAERLANLQGPS